MADFTLFSGGSAPEIYDGGAVPSAVTPATITGVTPDPFNLETTSDPNSSITRLGQSFADSINSVLGWGTAATNQALTLKNTILKLEGKTVPGSTTIATAANNSLTGNLSANAQNYLLIGGIIAAGVGLIYFMRK